MNIKSINSANVFIKRNTITKKLTNEIFQRLTDIQINDSTYPKTQLPNNQHTISIRKPSLRKPNLHQYEYPKPKKQITPATTIRNFQQQHATHPIDAHRKNTPA